MQVLVTLGTKIMKSFGAQPHASWTKNTSTASWDSITYPSVIDDGQDPVVFTYDITWNEAGYQADNTKGWEALNQMTLRILKQSMIGMVLVQVSR